MGPTNARIPAFSLVRQNPDIATTISKLVQPLNKDAKTNLKDPSSFFKINSDSIRGISESIQSRIGDAENTFQLFPDIELCAQILISSILSPKDMVNVEIIYRTFENILPNDLMMRMVDIVRTEMEQHYKLQTDLPNILREVLFKSGSYVKAVLPESVVDELINGPVSVSMESISEITDGTNIVGLGFLGEPGNGDKLRLGFEAFRNGNVSTTVPNKIYIGTEEDRTPLPCIEVADNYKYLKLPKLARANAARKIKNSLFGNNLSLEGMEGVSYKEFEKILYKGPQRKHIPFVSVHTQDQAQRKSIGRPLVMKLPSEATIPVHVPGDPTDHIGYFVLVDEEGNPLSRHNNDSALANAGSLWNNGNNQLSSMILSKAKHNLVSNDTRNMPLDQAASLYASIVETDLIERLRNGVYGTDARISKNESIYRIMFARSLANQMTKLIYLPAEIVTYYANKYYENGVGKSLMDDLGVLISLRGILLFAKTMAMVKNSINITHVDIELDPNDPDPMKTIEIATHDVMKVNQHRFPFGLNSPSDLVDWVQRAGFEFGFSNHPGLPQTKINIDNKSLNHTIPDSDLEEMLRKQTIMTFGLTPETVDSGLADAEFATTIVQNNILLSKRVQQIQDQFSPKLTEDTKRIIRADGKIQEELISLIKESKDSIKKYLSEDEKTMVENNEDMFVKYILNMFIDNLVLELPKPDITTLESQSDAYEKYVDALDKAIDAWISSDFITSELAGELSNNIDAIKATLKAYFLRNWMAKNGFMAELADIVTKDEEGKPTIELSDIMREHLEGVTRTSLHFINKITEVREAANKDVAATGIEAGDTSSSGYSSDDSSDGADDSGDSDFGGDMDFDMSDIDTEGTETDADSDDAENEDNPDAGDSEVKQDEEK